MCCCWDISSGHVWLAEGNDLNYNIINIIIFVYHFIVGKVLSQISSHLVFITNG